MGTNAALSTAVTRALTSANPTFSPSSFASLITVRLTRTNFLLWKAQVVPNLVSANIFGYLDGTKVAPPRQIAEGTREAARLVPNPAYEIWRQIDQGLLGALLSSMTEEVLGQMTRVTTAAQAWAALGNMFAAENKAAVRQLRNRLQQTKKRDMTCAEFFHKMTGFADQMATVGHPLSDDEVIDYIVAGLGQEYDALMASLTIFNGEVSLNDFYSYLLSYEARQEQHITDGDFSSSANSVTRQADPRSDGARGGKPSGGGNGGGGQYGQNHGKNGGRNRWRPKCQICGKFGHEALKCKNRFNHTYQDDDHRDHRQGNMVTHGHANGPWFLDTGATDHLTNDLDRLSMQERYGGKDQVQVANGQNHEEGSSSR